MMKVLCTCAAKCDSGATAMEYALTAAVISVAFLTSAETLGNSLNARFESLSHKLETASREQGQPGGATSRVALPYQPDEAFSASSNQSQSQSR